MDESSRAPLPERMRPRDLTEFIGQKHLLAPGRFLHELTGKGKLASVVLWGPPGSGKTTLARLISSGAHARFVELSAVAAGIRELREVFAAAAEDLRLYATPTVLFVDELHRFSKTQQDVLLPAVERGTVYLVGSTTENPRICLTTALLSRVQILTLVLLSDEEVEIGVARALKDADRGLGDNPPMFDPDAWRDLIRGAGGDLRKALHALEWCALFAQDHGHAIGRAIVEQAYQGTGGRFDESVFYDMLSAFGKSLRGSDSDAALYWFLRMIDVGVDPRVPVRRMIVHASEDVGLANPQALQQAVAAMHALEAVGMPEARIPIGQAIIFVCEAAKSNSVVTALERAAAAIRKAPHAEVPKWLRDRHFADPREKDPPYLYPHEYPGHYVRQEYLPQEIADGHFYQPSDQGLEGKIIPRKHRRNTTDTNGA